MPHITLNSAEPGIRGLLRFRPETGRPLSELAEVLLRGPGTLTRGERELIAAYVSGLNDCQYCSSSHSACAAAQLPEGMGLVDQVRADASRAPVSGKMNACSRSPPPSSREGSRSPGSTSTALARRTRPTWRSTTRS
jgi:alkylhydroperoxidase family enzyme